MPVNQSTPLLARIGLSGRAPFFWKSGALLIATGMAAGGFGSHGLRKRADISPDSLRAWETAAHYIIFNGLGLLLISMHPRFSAHKFAGPAILGGGVVFSTSIFALVLNRDQFKFLGPITPMGGLAMIAGYISLVF